MNQFGVLDTVKVATKGRGKGGSILEVFEVLEELRVSKDVGDLRIGL